MKDKIKEVEDYFKTKLLNGDYEITKRDQYIYTVLIDNKYIFAIWVSGDVCNRDIYVMRDNYIQISFDTIEEKQTLHSKLYKDYNAYMSKNKVINDKIKELQKQII